MTVFANNCWRTDFADIQPAFHRLSALQQLTVPELTPEYRENRKVDNVLTRRAAIEKAERMLGSKAKVSLEDGLTS